MVVEAVMVRLTSRMSDGVRLPPEFFYTVEADDAFDVLHPTLCCSSTGGLKNGGLGEGRDGGLGEIATFCCGGIEPEGPRGVKRVLILQRLSVVGPAR